MNRILKSDSSLQYESERQFSTSSDSLSILIKNNYYSSDSVHGRELLTKFLNKIIDSNMNISSIVIIDSGTLLLDSNSENLIQVSTLLERSFLGLVCEDSTFSYSVKIPENLEQYLCDANVCFEQLLIESPTIVL